MEFQTLIENRRSVRKYSSHTNVTKEQIQQLVQAALEAPSWKNTETGRYYCVLSEDMSQKLRKECLYKLLYLLFGNVCMGTVLTHRSSVLNKCLKFHEKAPLKYVLAVF